LAIQVTYGRFKILRPTGDFRNLDQVFEVGIQFLKYCYDKANGDYLTALAFYNAGPGTKSGASEEKSMETPSAGADGAERA